jgi:MoaA/NifB/PqqE/SkfB family radical SAM enzyme
MTAAVQRSYSRIQFFGRSAAPAAKGALREERRTRFAKLKAILDAAPELNGRFQRLQEFSRRVRVSEYHITNACNIRCKGCWFFEYGHDRETQEEKSLEALNAFLVREREERKINAAMIIGGEPSLFPRRLAVFARNLDYLMVSSNGLRPIPMEGLENITIALSLFGGGRLDDELRAIKPSGQRFSGLFDSALANYRNDPRTGFVYALSEDGIEHIEETVSRIHENGNIVNFNFYSKYGEHDPQAMRDRDALVEEALRVKALYPDTVVSHPYYIHTMITGESHWTRFGYDVCPSISVDHPANAARIANGNPYLPSFNTWSPDLETIKFCCTSGSCGGCRDSQVVFSWLLVSYDRFVESEAQLRTWVEIAESYWRQMRWSPYHKTVQEHPMVA